MYLSLFLKGLKVGLQIAMPVGGMTILCIRRSLTGHYIIGVTTGVAIAIADSLYALVAAISLTQVSSSFWNTYETVFNLLSIAVIAFLGISTLRASTPERIHRERQDMSILKTFISTFMITLSSPMTILLFLGLFSQMAAEGYFDDYVSILCIALGVTMGAATWFIGLSSFVYSIRQRFSTQNIAQVSLISGIGLLGFAAYRLFSLWYYT